jgi:hypothetical protein
LKGFIGFLVFVFLNIFCYAFINLIRKKISQKIDFISILLSAIIITILFHVIAIIDDINSIQWIIISIPIAFIIALLSSFITSIIFQRYFMKKRGNQNHKIN